MNSNIKWLLLVIFPSIVGAFGAVQLVNCVQYMSLPKEERIAKSWCESNDGKYSERIYGHYIVILVDATCHVPVLKGKAGIKVGYKNYTFTKSIVDYDSGLTNVYAKEEDKFSMIRLIDPNVPSAPDSFKIGEFITKGKYN